MLRVSFHTLGCKLNYAETSTIAREFEKRGFEVVPFGEKADVTLINTCTVTEQAEQKCRNVIRRALRANPDAFIIVTGCYAQLRPEDIARIPGVDVVLGAQEKFQLFDLVQHFSKETRTQIHVSCIDEVNTFGPAYATGERTRAFLKIQDGCDYTCTFCTIPKARGKSRSNTRTRVIAQAKEIAHLGYQEIVLSGVNIGLYGQDQGTNLLELLRDLDQVEGIQRYRISSIEPNLLTDAIIEFVASSEKFQPHFHIPLQSGDNYVLRKMARRYRRELYADRVARIKALMPHACIGVDVIVGFPAEDEQRFEHTYRFLQELPISYLHVFTYSERPGTPAVEHIERFGQPVPLEERQRRSRMLRILSQKKRLAFYQEHQNTSRPVLWESAEKEGLMFGYTDNYIRVETSFDPERAGTIETVTLGSPTPRNTMTVASAQFLQLPVL